MRTPRSTYRLQVTPDFDLHAASRVLPYLHDLGVDWVYLSPVLQATEGSSHGYDVVDPTRVDDSRGGADGLAAVSAEARRLGMGVLVDIVPNHMGVADPTQNRWWWDLLRLGRSSAYADAFDVDWDAFGDRVMVPVLGDRGESSFHRVPRAGGALRAGLVASRRRRAQLPPLLHDHHAGRRAGRGAVGVRRGRTARSGGGSRRASSTGCGSTTPTASATPRRTSTTWPA